MGRGADRTRSGNCGDNRRIRHVCSHGIAARAARSIRFRPPATSMNIVRGVAHAVDGRFRRQHLLNAMVATGVEPGAAASVDSRSACHFTVTIVDEPKMPA